MSSNPDPNFKVESTKTEVISSSKELPQLIKEIVEKKVNEEIAHDKATLFGSFPFKGAVFNHPQSTLTRT
ncbi:hypothetical protein, partial [Legionella pneumophila]